MSELTLYHIDKISRDISRQEITFSHLPDDLIDHICCDVENEMLKGLDFSEAYQIVKQKMGPRRLKEIQEETLYLVDTKYRNMKKLMKISGVTGTVLFGFAGLFKIQHWPMAGVMMTLGALILAFVFLPSALGILWKESHNRKRIFLFISAFSAGFFFIIGTLMKVQHWPAAGIFLTLAALSGMIFFIPSLALSRFNEQENKSKRPAYILGAAGIICFGLGMLFKIQHWPLATFLITLGVILLCLIALPVYTFISFKEEKYINARFIFIILGLLAIIIPAMMINLNLQNSYKDGFFVNQDQEQALFNFKYKSNRSYLTLYHDSLNYSKMNQLHLKTDSLLAFISKIQLLMIDQSTGNTEPSLSDEVSQSQTGYTIQYRKLSKPFQTDLVKKFLLPGCKTREDLNNALLEYSGYLKGIVSQEILSKFQPALASALYLPSENSNSDDISLMAGLHSLELLKNSLLTAESYLLKQIASNK